MRATPDFPRACRCDGEERPRFNPNTDACGWACRCFCKKVWTSPTSGGSSSSSSSSSSSCRAACKILWGLLLVRVVDLCECRRRCLLLVLLLLIVSIVLLLGWSIQAERRKISLPEHPHQASTSTTTAGFSWFLLLKSNKNSRDSHSPSRKNLPLWVFFVIIFLPDAKMLYVDCLVLM